ncbi:hypothetical protein IFM89_000158 [Coptis chinensis]|uniref:ADP/ATP translocase n=1 Tax=Coptis chinensis TaxID=261450 RepID=A0A835LFT9_9MAGN|nr:hypothetical protein IFM89_000158 [Coptis chinensis]
MATGNGLQETWDLEVLLVLHPFSLSILWITLELVLLTMQSPQRRGRGGGGRQFNGLIDVYKKTLKFGGIAGLYHGFNIIVYTGLYFGMYDSLKPVLLTGNLQLVFAWCVYLNAEQNSKPTNNNRHYYYPMLMGASKDKIKNEMQLTSAARAIHLDNDISEYRRWFVPVVDGNHWWLYVFDPSARKVMILDSLASSTSYICGGTE